MRRLSLLPLLLLSCAPKPATYAPLRTPPAQVAEIAILGADVWTMDTAKPHAQAVAIAGGMIIGVGTDAEIKELVAPTTHVIDMRGAAVTPGLVDAHCHLYGLGADLENVDVRGLASEQDAARAMGEAAKQRTGGEWLVGRGWDQNRWAGGKFPTKASLDAVVRDRPVAVTRIDGHAVWVNSAALAAAHIDRTTQVAGGRIEHDAKGEPTGVLVDNATELVDKAMPAATAEQRARRIEAGLAKAIATGITGVHEMGIEDETAAAYRALEAKHTLPIRVYAFLLGDVGKLDRLRVPPEGATGHFAMRGVKFFADGALGSRGARLYADYDDDPGNRGLWVTEPGQLKAAIAAASAGGWQVAVHAIGDAAVGSVLDALADPARGADRRPRIEHLQIVAPADVARVVATRAIASMQPTHATSDMAWAEARIGGARATGAYAWRTMVQRGVPLAFGSDFPVEDVGPLLGVYAAVTRQDAAGQPAGGWHPEQKLTLDEALAAFTKGAAYAEFAEGKRGVIAVGMQADLTGFDRALKPDRSLLDTHAAWTIVDGVVRWERGK